eukprot:6734048-Alexandrium_andersonii.AAC.1
MKQSAACRSHIATVWRFNDKSKFATRPSMHPWLWFRFTPIWERMRNRTRFTRSCMQLVMDALDAQAALHWPTNLNQRCEPGSKQYTCSRDNQI